MEALKKNSTTSQHKANQGALFKEMEARNKNWTTPPHKANQGAMFKLTKELYSRRWRHAKSYWTTPPYKANQGALFKLLVDIIIVFHLNIEASVFLPVVVSWHID
ncbi:hypothetical protein DEO72_LG8g1756 [Vigna unguiculata]|uniref:Uncharacterized protein n=1 Tax=Vigna unguiculata TaxID=3917 RepID=A0A4D6MSX2_VIGUN|nr:hypothetical protein DEO72_LG8g1756 [Vigna unguiculata]